MANVAAPVVAPAAAQGGAAAGWFGPLRQTLLNMALMYFAMSFFRGQTATPPGPSDAASGSSAAEESSHAGDVITPPLRWAGPVTPRWRSGDLVTLNISFTDSSNETFFDVTGGAFSLGDHLVVQPPSKKWVAVRSSLRLDFLKDGVASPMLNASIALPAKQPSLNSDGSTPDGYLNGPFFAHVALTRDVSGEVVRYSTLLVKEVWVANVSRKNLLASAPGPDAASSQSIFRFLAPSSSNTSEEGDAKSASAADTAEAYEAVKLVQFVHTLAAANSSFADATALAITNMGEQEEGSIEVNAPDGTLPKTRTMEETVRSYVTDSGFSELVKNRRSRRSVAAARPTITVSPVIDFSYFQSPTQGIVPQIAHMYRINEQDGSYPPIVYDNMFWLLDDYWTRVNQSTTRLNVSIVFEPVSLVKFVMFNQMDASFGMQEAMGITADGEKDGLKRMLLETNPYLLGLTVFVSLLHLVFEYLAFSNDVSFWKNKKDFRGMSLRMLATSCYFQTVIFLYLFDHETSWTVVIPSGIGVLIEYWKLSRTVRFSKKRRPLQVTAAAAAATTDVQAEAPLGEAALLPTFIASRLPFDVTYEKSYQDSTSTFDQTACRYLFYACAPLLLGYSIYSLIVDEHKGWYSFLISTQVRFIYFAGFVTMTPQIFINWKMKSVAHLPWRAFVYKALNTFIDDLFAFIIKMPTLHRIACFRDDIVFVILMYQRWVYPVDKSRVNEFGQGGGGTDPAAATTATSAASTDAVEDATQKAICDEQQAAIKPVQSDEPQRQQKPQSPILQSPPRQKASES